MCCLRATDIYVCFVVCADDGTRVMDTNSWCVCKAIAIRFSNLNSIRFVSIGFDFTIAKRKTDCNDICTRIHYMAMRVDRENVALRLLFWFDSLFVCSVVVYIFSIFSIFSLLSLRFSFPSSFSRVVFVPRIFVGRAKD